jgi:hypothetical protein
MRASWWAVLLYLALLFAFGVRLIAVFEWKQSLSYDESISYLCSAATQGRYDEDMKGTEHRATTIQAIQEYYARPDLDFRKVAAEMAVLDRHPPLYWWGLHAVHHVIGFQLYGGLLIELLLGVLLCGITYHIIRACGGTPLLALFVATVYYLSPAVAISELEARNYPLLALWVLCGAILTERITSGQGRPWTWGALVLVNVGGFLTHYYYGFFLIPGVLLAFARNGFRRSTWVYTGSLVLSLAGFLLVFPEFFDFLPVYRSEPPTERYTIVEQTKVLLYGGWATFFATAHMGRYLAMALLAAMGISLVAVLRVRERWTGALRNTDRGSFFLWFLIWCVGFTTVFYLARIAPPQAAGEQYYAYIWPLFACAVVVLGRMVIPRKAWAITAVATVLVGMLQLPKALAGSEYMTSIFPSEWFTYMDGSSLLVTNELYRSNLPRTAIHLRSDLPVVLSRELRTDLVDPTGALSVLANSPRSGHERLLALFTARHGTPDTVLTTSRHALFHWEAPLGSQKGSLTDDVRMP